MKLDRPLEGERIVIRSYAPEDLDFCTGMWFDPENGRYLSDPAREYVDEVFQRALDGLQGLLGELVHIHEMLNSFGRMGDPPPICIFTV